jgi:Protein of unknown function (DUF2933)
MSQYLPYVLVLACPVSMGLMMWFMMRSPKGTQSGQQESPDVRISRLEREIELLREAHGPTPANQERPAS